MTSFPFFLYEAVHILDDVPRLRFHRGFNGWSLEVGLSLSKKIVFICFDENPLKMIKNALYFILKAFFVLKILKFSPWNFGCVEETA